jgi:hypothetical protein
MLLLLLVLLLFLLLLLLLLLKERRRTLLQARGLVEALLLRLRGLELLFVLGLLGARDLLGLADAALAVFG